MKRYILTGTPGSGKTSILHELKSRGYRVVEEETYISLGYDLIKIAPEALSQRVRHIIDRIGS